MQQAVASSQLTMPPVSVGILFGNQILRQQLKQFLETLSKSIQEIGLFNINKANKISEIDLNREIDSLVDQLVENFTYLESRTDLVASQLVQSLKRSNSTFYENNYGFTPDQLMNCEYKENLASFGVGQLRILKKKNFVNSLFLNLQQKRGFMTKRKQIDENEKKKLFGLQEILKKSFAGDETNKTIDSILNPSSPSSKRLGSIFSQTTKSSDTFETNSSKSLANSKEVENKIKIAFAEGLIYAKKSQEKKTNQFGPFRLFLFILSLIFLFSLVFRVSIVASPNDVKNGSGGINIRSLTGSVNYEVNPELVNVKFDDVKGLPEAKKELTEIVDFLKDPEKYTRLGARLPKGILLIGPPGCGKTLLAKSVAGEAQVPFFQASGSDFDEMFVGTGSKRVRQLFQAARAKAPCVIFIDEIDSVGSTRTNSAIHPHANQTINQLLAEMDGFQKNEGVIVLGATNRRETLDSALMRPGRFDVEVRIDKPNLKERIEILEYYLDKVKRDSNVDVKYLARQLTGLGGSSIENVVNQAALRAVVTNNQTVKMEHLEWALDRALMGYGKSRLADEECNKNTAYHEAGHVLVAYYTKDSNPLHKVTILPRSKSLGHTAFVPEDEGYSKTKAQLLALMDVAMGGRVAEEIAFGSDKVTTGASSDFQSATQIATQMIKMYGMNEKIGIRVFDSGREKEELSPQTQELLDQEIKKTLQDSYERAKHILKTHSNELKMLAEALLVHETLDVDQIKKLLDHK